VRYAFSGDDHDYCELTHRGYASGGGGIREITVKSISWAMGVRRPGFVLVSLWNPVDAAGKPLSGDGGKTVQTKLCLLPDQLGIFFRYAGLFAVTLVLLGARAVLAALFNVLPAAPATSNDPILPTTSVDKAPSRAFDDDDDVVHSAHSSTSSTTAANGASLQPRSTTSRPRTASPLNGYGYTPTPSPLPHQQSTSYALPLVQNGGFYGDEDKKAGGKVYGGGVSTANVGKKRKKGFALFRQEMRDTLGRVLVCGLVWYFWLVWRG
jgi:hypothetical protein